MIACSLLGSFSVVYSMPTYIGSFLGSAPDLVEEQFPFRSRRSEDTSPLFRRSAIGDHDGIKLGVVAEESQKPRKCRLSSI
jgi:hypothetical protein